MSENGRPVVPPEHQRNWYRFANITVALVLAGFLLLLYLADAKISSSDSGDEVILFGRRLPNTCVFRHLFNTKCLGCGLTRAVVMFLDGRAEQAAKLHPSAGWVILWVAVQLIVRLAFAFFAIRPRLLWVPDLCISVASMTTAIYVPTIWSESLPSQV